MHPRRYQLALLNVQIDVLSAHNRNEDGLICIAKVLGVAGNKNCKFEAEASIFLASYIQAMAM